MHSSILSILALGGFCLTLSSAIPTTSPPPGIAATVNHLDSKGMLHWTPAGNGGRTTTISGELVSYAQDQLASNSTKTLKVRGGPKADVGSFTNIGQIAGYAASYACEKSGAYGVSATIESYATDACDSLVSQVPGVPIAETAWRVWQSAVSPGADGKSLSTVFRYFTSTAAAPTLTQSICALAFEDLTSVFCQGKGDKGPDTRGGEIRIGSKDDYLMIGFDPNDA